ncbi:hypothetical protein LB579_33465, partial [Mesorhizobium sp. BR1-1-7]
MSLPRYNRYQDSGTDWLKEVPEHWNLRRLGYYFAERREKVSDKEFAALSVTKNGIVSQLETAAKTDDGDNRKKVVAGDFVINSRSDRKGSAGIASQDGSVSLINTVLTPVAGIDRGFVHHLLRSVAFQEEYYRYGKGIVADLWSTNYSEMKAITLAMPPHPEQSAIAAFLDRETGKIDALVEEQKRLIELLKEKRQVVISHAVTKGLDPDAKMKPSGVEWLGEVPEHWTVAPIGSRYSVQLGKMLDSDRITGDHLRPYLRVFDVQWGSINVVDLPEMDFDEDARKRYSLRVGDLLVNEGGSYVGRSAIWQGELEECYYQKALHRLRPHNPQRDQVDFLYFVMTFATQFGVFIAGGNQNTIDHLPAEKLRRYRFGFPRFDEQLAIANHLRQVSERYERLIAAAEEAVRLLQER